MFAFGGIQKSRFGGTGAEAGDLHAVGFQFFVQRGTEVDHEGLAGAVGGKEGHGTKTGQGADVHDFAFVAGLHCCTHQHA